MIVVGVFVVGLWLIALAGRALDEGEPSPGLIVVLVVVVALLLGIAHYRAGRKDEF